MIYKAWGLLVVIGLALAISACGSRSHTAVVSGTGSAADDQSGSVSVASVARRDPSEVLLTSEDIVDRPYEVLGDIVATVSKNTIFDDDPTREKVDEALREKASEMGADAVVLIRYGTVGVSFASWGALDGRGRAVVFTN